MDHCSISLIRVCDILPIHIDTFYEIINDIIFLMLLYDIKLQYQKINTELSNETYMLIKKTYKK